MEIRNVYLKDVRKHKMVSRAKEIELSEKIMGGNDALCARNELAEANLRLAITIAHEYKCFYMDEMDLIQEANIGLITAAEYYDWQQGQFDVFARWWIREAIFMAVRSYGGMIRIPKNKYSVLLRYKRYRERYYQKTGFYPTVYMFLEDTGINDDGVLEFIQLQRFFASLDAPLVGGEDDTLADTVESDGKETDYDQPTLLYILYNRLGEVLTPEEHKSLLAWYGLDGETRVSVAEAYGITVFQVSVLKDAALRKVRDSEFYDILKEVL